MNNKTLVLLSITGNSSVVENTPLTQYTAQAFFSDGSKESVTPTTWSSSNLNVASILNSGLLTVKEVSADTEITIYANYSTKTAEMKITIINSGSSGTQDKELLVNGGFELGNNGNWVLSNSFYISTDKITYPNPYNGNGYAWVANSDGTPGINLYGNMYQSIMIPSEVTSVNLSVWVSITTKETSNVPKDVLTIAIQDSLGKLELVRALSNVNANINPKDYQQIPFNLNSYIGKTIRLNFLATTDGINPTTFRIDDVSITAKVPNPKTLISLNINGPSAVKENDSAKFSADAVFSDGSIEPVTPNWSVNSSAATISSSGVLNAGSVDTDTSVVVKADYTSGGKTNTKNVTIINSQPQVGSLQVSLSPQGAIGAQWRVDGGNYQNSGNIVYDLSVGDNHIVDFKDIPGWIKPNSQFVSIKNNQTTPISGNYTLNTYTISTYAGAGGNISPSGDVILNYGSNQTFNITPNNGYKISDVVVDGVSQGAITTYPFTNVTANRMISANFNIIINIPFPPTNISASDGTYTDKISITWGVVSNATYTIYRATSNSGTKTYIGTATGTSYEDTSALAGTTYYYWVTATDSNGTSNYSSYDTGWRSGVIPYSPTEVSASAGNGQVTINWDTASSATSYNIYWDTTSGVSKIKGTKISNVTSPYPHTGRTNGTTYYYVVTAINDYGESGESNQVNATPSTLTIPTDGLVAYYSFNGNANDGSGNSNNGTVYGATLTADRFWNANSAYSFDGVNDYIMIPSNSSLDIKEDITIAAWVKFNNLSNNNYSQILWRGDSQYAQDPYSLYVLADNVGFRRDINTGTGNDIKNITKNIGDLDINIFHLLVGSYDRTNGIMRLYIDGNMGIEEYMPGMSQYITSSMWNVIGAVDYGNWQFFNGIIDDIRIYNRALSNIEIKVLYQEVPAFPPTNVSVNTGNNQVTISWNVVTNATSYNIYWSITPGVTKANGMKISTVTSPYSNTGLINGTTYYYIVTAVNSYGESAESSEVSGTPNNNNNVLFSDDFNDGNYNGWTVVDRNDWSNGVGEWSVENGILNQKADWGCMLLTGDTTWQNYTFEAETSIKSVYYNDWDGPEFLFRVKDSKNFYVFYLHYPFQRARIVKWINGNETILADTGINGLPLNLNTTYKIKCEVNGSDIKCYINGNLILSAIDSTFASGKIGFRTWRSQSTFDNVIVTAYTSTNINQPPQVSLYPEYETTWLSGSINFTFDTSDPDGYITKIKMEYGDGKFDITPPFIHTYNSTGKFTARLTVWDNNYDSSWDESNIIVPTDYDNDGLPDTWEVTYNLSPYNSTGNNGWNGDPDGDGITNGDEWKNVSKPNDPLDNKPIANAGLDQIVNPSLVILDGSGSSDPNGDPLTYLWYQTSGTIINLINPNAVNPSFIGKKAGDYIFSLIVNDGKIDSVSDAVIITINNIVPTADAGIDQTVYSNTTVTLNGSGSTDANGDNLIYTWTQTVGTNVTLSDNQNINPTFTPIFSGVYTFQLIVSDGKDNSLLDTVNIIVNQPNTVPTANAGSDQTVNTGTLVTLNGSGSSDADGNYLTYTWTQIAGTNVTLSNNQSINPTFTPIFSGVYTFQLIVNDGTDNSLPDIVNIILNQPNTVPTANAGIDQTINTGTKVTMDGSGSSDADGDSLTYTWAQTAGTTVTLSDTHSMSPTFTPIVSGVYTFQLIVNDGTDNSLSDIVNIIVNHKTRLCLITNIIPENSQVGIINKMNDIKDRVLIKNSISKYFVKLYYKISPYLINNK